MLYWLLMEVEDAPQPQRIGRNKTHVLLVGSLQSGEGRLRLVSRNFPVASIKREVVGH